MPGFAKKPGIGEAGPRRVGAGIGRRADIAWRSHAWAQAQNARNEPPLGHSRAETAEMEKSDQDSHL